jgi:alkane 1-monooxygenase
MIDRLKYLCGFSIPLVAIASIAFPVQFAFGALIYAFGIIPLIELLSKPDASKIQDGENIASDRIYDMMLLLGLPVQLFTLGFFLYQISSFEFSTLQLIGMTSAAGIVCGVIGINIAHELGHRSGKLEQFVAQCLLLSTQYAHFFVEHNHGHHRYVATPLDPATARKGQSLYAFWIQSLFGSYRSAWRIQLNTLKKKGHSFLSLHNNMLVYLFIQLSSIAGIGFFLGWFSAALYLSASFIGIILLETINYIEHYGLLRKQTITGNFERVVHGHSWNADYPLGRMMLFELTRHSDHHYKASKKYQVLESYTDAPQLPAGYPAMMLLSLIPPLWFAVMDARISENGEGLSQRLPQHIA